MMTWLLPKSSFSLGSGLRLRTSTVLVLNCTRSTSAHNTSAPNAFTRYSIWLKHCNDAIYTTLVYPSCSTLISLFAIHTEEGTPEVQTYQFYSSCRTVVYCSTPAIQYAHCDRCHLPYRKISQLASVSPSPSPGLLLKLLVESEDPTLRTTLLPGRGGEGEFL